MVPQTPVRLNGQLVGVVIDHELVQKRRASVHMLRTRPFPGWAVDNQILTIARTLGADAVRIVDTEGGAEYVASMETLDREGRPVNFGYGAQTALPTWKWRREGMKDTQPAVDRQPDHAQPAGPVQASLFVDR